LKEIRKFLGRVGVRPVRPDGSESPQLSPVKSPSIFTKKERKPTGFACPRAISDSLVIYLREQVGLDELTVNRSGQEQTVLIKPGCQLARNEVTRVLHQHFKQLGLLKDKSNKRKIYLDQTTTELFQIDLEDHVLKGHEVSPEGEPIITIFQFQSYLKYPLIGEIK